MTQAEPRLRIYNPTMACGVAVWPACCALWVGRFVVLLARIVKLGSL
jgi:hypothetical protein